MCVTTEFLKKINKKVLCKTEFLFLIEIPKIFFNK